MSMERDKKRWWPKDFVKHETLSWGVREVRDREKWLLSQPSASNNPQRIKTGLRESLAFQAPWVSQSAVYVIWHSGCAPPKGKEKGRGEERRRGKKAVAKCVCVYCVYVTFQWKYRNASGQIDWRLLRVLFFKRNGRVITFFFRLNETVNDAIDTTTWRFSKSSANRAWILTGLITGWRDMRSNECNSAQVINIKFINWRHLVTNVFILSFCSLSRLGQTVKNWRWKAVKQHEVPRFYPFRLNAETIND